MGTVSIDYAELPGGDLVLSGVQDLTAGRTETESALLVTAASTRLRAAGIPVPDRPIDVDATHRLYRSLGARHGNDAHGRYLALLRQLESFARAAEHAARR